MGFQESIFRHVNVCSEGLLISKKLILKRTEKKLCLGNVTIHVAQVDFRPSLELFILKIQTGPLVLLNPEEQHDCRHDTSNYS